MKRRPIFIALMVLVVAIAGIAVYLAFRFLAGVDSPAESYLNSPSEGQISVLSQNLDTPWSIGLLPDKRLLITERDGTLSITGKESRIFEIADVVESGEGGLLGVAVHPDYAKNNYIYVYKTVGETNIVERYSLTDSKLTDRRDILTGIPAAANHNGGELEFGPDKMLYITTGDAGEENNSQDKNSLAGKILRIDEDGKIPNDNPFNNAVWSYGHRNPQGITWDEENQLWSTEHGPSGLESGLDEINLITKGANYGWPEVRGDEEGPGYAKPILHSGENETWAPGGLAYSDGSLYFSGLRGQSLYQAEISENKVTLKRHLNQKYGRLRAVIARDSELLISTSNRDGRGNPKQGDDRIILVPVNTLE